MFKDNCIFSSGSLFVQQSRTVSAILLEGTVRNMSEKVFRK